MRHEDKALMIVPGSVADVSGKEDISLAEALMGAKLAVLHDVSASMSTRDAPDGLSRYDAADNALAEIQRKNPGQVAVIGFSTQVQFFPGGIPTRFSEGTDMVRALEYVEPFDGLLKIVLISDGEPDSERDTLRVAARFKSPIHTIYIGPKGGFGEKFLQRLAKACGGISATAKAPGLLEEPVQLLLSATT